MMAAWCCASQGWSSTARRASCGATAADPGRAQVFDVLAHLAEHRDRLVTKEELLDEVWGQPLRLGLRGHEPHQVGASASADSGREQRVIRTIHRRGFRLVAEVVREGRSSDR
jgi:DNA-binding response OmpR family regulator